MIVCLNSGLSWAGDWKSAVAVSGCDPGQARLSPHCSIRIVVFDWEM